MLSREGRSILPMNVCKSYCRLGISFCSFLSFFSGQSGLKHNLQGLRPFMCTRTMGHPQELQFFFTGLVLLFLIAWRGLPQAGLFTIAVACTMGLSLFQSLTAAPFNRDDIALFAGPLGLIFGILIYVYIIQSGIVRIVIIAGVGLVNTMVALIATNTWSSWLDNRGAPSPLLPLLSCPFSLPFQG